MRRSCAPPATCTDENGALRFRLPRKLVVMDDLVCGRIEVDRSKSQNRDGSPEADMTIRRADGGWIFHFVNVVDDIEMKITHVIRGEDHLSNTPKHLELFEALGAPPPRYAHIPLILNKDGTKMSKRDQGAAVGAYIEGGYVPEAVRNFLCLLGWSPKDDREIMPISEVIERFDPAQINRKAAQFDLEKCDWINQQTILQMPLEALAVQVEPWLKKAGVNFGTRADMLPVLALVRERLKKLSDGPAWMDYFFTEDFPFDAEAVAKVTAKPGALDHLRALAAAYGPRRMDGSRAGDFAEIRSDRRRRKGRRIRASRTPRRDRTQRRREPLPHARSPRPRPRARTLRTRAGETCSLTKSEDSDAADFSTTDDTDAFHRSRCACS